MMLFYILAPVLKLQIKMFVPGGSHLYIYFRFFFANSLACNDIVIVVKFRSVLLISNFWRAQAMIGYVLLLLGFGTRQDADYTLNCDWDSATDSQIHDCPARYTDIIIVSNTMYRLASTMAVLSLLYILQLDKKMGPILINLSRVTLDVFTMTVIFIS
jgi:hypothetical protein